MVQEADQQNDSVFLILIIINFAVSRGAGLGKRMIQASLCTWLCLNDRYNCTICIGQKKKPTRLRTNSLIRRLTVLSDYYY